YPIPSSKICAEQDWDSHLFRDADGNLTDDGPYAYTWDAENRLVAVEPTNPSNGDKKVVFEYDYMSRRVRKSVYNYDTGWESTAETDLKFVYDGWNVVLVLDDSNDTVRKYTWGLDLSQTIHDAGGIGGLLAVEETATTGQPKYWFFYDANGNLGQAFKVSTGAVAARYEYDPYGNIIGPDDDDDGDWRDDAGPYAETNPMRFSTKWFDAEVGLYNYGMRYYLPRLGRWLNRDPIEEEGGLNLYVFLSNDPANNIDIVGLWSGSYRCRIINFGCNRGILYSYNKCGQSCTLITCDVGSCPGILSAIRNNYALGPCCPGCPALGPSPGVYGCRSGASGGWLCAPEN
ncbi:unnamed protein product, partial [marine sediment metagenome]